MIYLYRCLACDQTFDVVKSVKDFDREENCLSCGNHAKRQFVPNVRALLRQSGMQDTAEYNPGLGCVIKGKNHRKEICKIKGVEEIGNESADTIHNHYDKKREEKIEQSWNEATAGWVGDGSS